jgi:Arc/MetJ-type ribon-helix-helix transcriptional regulator
MPTLVRAIRKKKRGRPATGRDPVTAIRLPEDLRVRVEAWAAKLDDTPSRSEAIRRLVEMGLASARPRIAKASGKTAARASKLAGQMIDTLSDDTAPIEEREKRKRRLIKGPSEFREMRTDLPKAKG